MLSIANHQREMKIKTIMWYHPTPVRMAVIKKRKNKSQMLAWMQRKGNSYALLVGM